ncbi:MAG TPA: AMP-binding protein [Candidatus Dormibacteraeota bacterium]|nr:AMP-binding protein [Candidatus Dormibacteraeota bacterium]
MDSMLEWSRAAWRRHLPNVPDIRRLVSELGDGTIHGLAHATAIAVPDKLAVRIGDESITHGELDDLASRFAASLGIKDGDRVLLAAPVSLNWLGAYLGVLRAGGVAVLANPAYTQAELDGIVQAAAPAMVLREIVKPDAEARPWHEGAAPDSVALLAFTSGTTGKPKGVPLTHRNLLTSIRAAMAAWRWKRYDHLVHALPLFHQHGLGGLHATLIAGSSLHLLPRFDSAELTGAVEKATVLFAVPTMYQRLKGTSRNRLRLCVSGSAPLSRAVAAHAEAVLGRTPLVRYGTTESGLDTSQVISDPPADTVGIPLPGVELRLDEDGEIQLRGPQVAAAFLDDDGWFRTGDLGRLDDATGHLVIDRRIKEMIITGGMKVSPREVEVALESHPAVAEAAVAGVASERWGEQVTAWVVMKPGASFDVDALLEHSATLLAPYKRPKEIKRLEALPRNHVGKIDRRLLRES